MREGFNQLWKSVDYVSDTRRSFEYFFNNINGGFSQENLMNHFGMRRTTNFDGLTDAYNLRDLVHRAVDEKNLSEFFERSQRNLKEFCEQNYPE